MFLWEKSLSRSISFYSHRITWLTTGSEACATTHHHVVDLVGLLERNLLDSHDLAIGKIESLVDNAKGSLAKARAQLITADNHWHSRVGTSGLRLLLRFNKTDRCSDLIGWR